MTLDRDHISDRLAAAGYIADRDIATALWLMEFLKRPLLLEGEAGVGKTEVAKALATVFGRRLIRLQCYEGIDASQALYEWNYSRQLIAVRAMDAGSSGCPVPLRNQRSNSPVPHPRSMRSVSSRCCSGVSPHGWSGAHAVRASAWISATPSVCSG